MRTRTKIRTNSRTVGPDESPDEVDAGRAALVGGIRAARGTCGASVQSVHGPRAERAYARRRDGGRRLARGHVCVPGARELGRRGRPRRGVHVHV